MTFSQKYEENALAGSFDEHLFRIKLSKVIVALRTSSFKAYNEVMEFLEKDCADAINEIYRLNNTIDDNEEKYDRNIRNYEDELDSLDNKIESLQDKKYDLELKIEKLNQEIIKKDREIQGYIDDMTWIKQQEEDQS